MKLGSQYDYFFKNNGRCPFCGWGLIMHIGCIGPLFGETTKCPLGINFKRDTFMYYRLANYKKSLKYKYEQRKNLDIQRKKSYFKTND